MKARRKRSGQDLAGQRWAITPLGEACLSLRDAEACLHAGQFGFARRYALDARRCLDLSAAELRPARHQNGGRL